MVVKFLSSLAQRIPKKNLCVYQPKPRFMSHQGDVSHKGLVDITEDIKNYRLFYPEFKKKLLHECQEAMNDDIETMNIEMFLDYNLPIGRQTPSAAMIKLYRTIQNAYKKKLPLEDAELFTMTWLIELSIVTPFVIDDFLDLSLHRRGKPCWYTVGCNRKYAPSDMIKMNVLTFRLLERCFGDRPFYKSVVETFYMAHVQGVTANAMTVTNRITDGTAEVPGYYRKLGTVKGKFGFLIPMKTAVYVAGYENELKPEAISEICSDIAYLAQCIHDYVDCFVQYDDGEILYEDIRQGNTTWPLETAMVRANNEQKEKIKKHYGRPSDESVREIVSLYKDLSVYDQFEPFAKEIEQNIRRKAAHFPAYFEMYVEDVLSIVNAFKNKPMGKKYKREPLKLGQI